MTIRTAATVLAAAGLATLAIVAGGALLFRGGDGTGLAAIDANTVGRMEEEVRSALTRWEPRIDVVGIDFDLDGVDRGELVIRIDYRVRATNHYRNLVYPFYVIPHDAE